MASNNVNLNPPFTFMVKITKFCLCELWECMTKDNPLDSVLANPTLDQIKFNIQEKANKSKAMLLMQNVVADTVLYKILACKTAKEAWDRLKEEYKGNNRLCQMQVLNLKREF